MMDSDHPSLYKAVGSKINVVTKAKCDGHSPAMGLQARRLLRGSGGMPPGTF